MEPGTNAEILQFYKKIYNITFPLFANIKVNGFGANLLWTFLSK